jgi:hypothetical protein
MIIYRPYLSASEFSTQDPPKTRLIVMKWIIEDLKSVFAELQRGQTWLGIGLIALFALLAYFVASFALRTDSVLMFVRHSASNCREMTNGIIIAMFCGMIFFLFTALLTLGELQRYLKFKSHGARQQTRQALIWGILWGTVAISIAVGALVFFNLFCR